MTRCKGIKTLKDFTQARLLEEHESELKLANNELANIQFQLRFASNRLQFHIAADCLFCVKVATANDYAAGNNSRC